MMRGVRAAALVVLAVLLGAAYTPPPLHGRVVDTTGALSAADVRDLDLTIDAMSTSGGFQLVVLVTGLGGETIEDVAYTAFNTWGVGDAGKDNGVLLVIAPTERRIRIETGKGIGGALPDLKTNDIIRQTIAPLLQQGQLRKGIEDGAVAIANAVRADDTWKRPDPQGVAHKPDQPLDWKFALLVVGIVIVIAVVRYKLRGVLGPPSGGGGGGFFGGGGGFGGGGFGGGGGGGFGGGGGGGSGYSGGGGHSGGGGSSDSF